MTVSNNVWFEDSKGHVRELSPVNDLQVYDGSVWVGGRRIAAPTDLVLEIHLKVMDLSPKDAIRSITGSLRRGALESDIVSLEVKEPK